MIRLAAINRLLGTTVVVLALGCGSAGPQQQSRQDGGCPFDPAFAVDARRYATVDANDPESGKWTPWRVEAALSQSGDEVRGHITMRGDSLEWHLPVIAKLHGARCELRGEMGGHHPFTLNVRFGATVTGSILSVDDTWEF